jgi:outer membrane protein assembly factor BamD
MGLSGDLASRLSPWQCDARSSSTGFEEMSSAGALRPSEDRLGSTGRWARLAAAAILALSLGGCDSFSGPTSWFGGGDAEDADFVDTPAETLFNEGLSAFNGNDYGAAKKSFSVLEKQYPYSEWTKKGLMLTTASQYYSREYADAIGSGRRYLQLYPADKDANYALYLIGMSYYNQIPDIGRDQERSEKALAAFDELITRYPDSEYVPDAKRKVLVARDQLAAKEMSVGRYYLNQRNYTGAVNRFREVLVKYQTTRHSEEALARLAEAYLSLGVVDEAQTAGAVLGNNFPESEWYKDTFKLLQSRGLEPRENTGSWISRAFRSLIGGG